MPITTIEELFEAGGQHTVESHLEWPGGTPAGAVDALRRRFGPELGLSDSDLRLFTGLVIGAMRAAETINEGGLPGPADVPLFPGLSSGYQYTVLVSVADPNDPTDESRRIEVPLSVTSANPLDLEQITERVHALLENWERPRDTSPGGQAADLIRRDVLIRSRLTDMKEAIPDLTEVGIIGVYQRG